MTERQISGSKLPLWRGTGTGTPETFDLMACLTSVGVSQGSNSITTDTFCGTLSSGGTNNATISFDIVPVFQSASGKVTFAQMQDDYKNHVVHNWKITTAINVTGDPILAFEGFITELNWTMGADGSPMSGTGTIQVDGDGITTTIVS
jgi:hypothetical protein